MGDLVTWWTQPRTQYHCRPTLIPSHKAHFTSLTTDLIATQVSCLLELFNFNIEMWMLPPPNLLLLSYLQITHNLNYASAPPQLPFLSCQTSLLQSKPTHTPLVCWKTCSPSGNHTSHSAQPLGSAPCCLSYKHFILSHVFCLLHLILLPNHPQQVEQHPFIPLVPGHSLSCNSFKVTLTKKGLHWLLGLATHQKAPSLPFFSLISSRISTSLAH